MRILLIEDDRSTGEFLSATLSAHRYAVDVVADGAAGLELASHWHYDLILLDILLPTLNGIEVCRRLRDQGCQTPILMLTTQDSNDAVIAGLDAGADDYVTKSCDPSQLLARVRALLRRSGAAATTPVLTWGPLCLDPALTQVTYNGAKLMLRPKEYSLLELFLRYPHRILSRSAIIEHLWPIEETPVEGSVTNLIKDLRYRLKSAGIQTDPIETVYGLGYRLKTAPVEAQLSSARTRSAAPPSRVQSAASSNKARGQLAIQQIGERFCRSVEQRLDLLEAAAQSLQTDRLHVPQQRAAKLEAHKLAGGLGTFGYIQASHIAQAIEHLLERLLEGDASQESEVPVSEQFAELLTALKQALMKSPADELCSSVYPDNNPSNHAKDSLISPALVCLGS